MKRTSALLTKVTPVARRAYSSEMANALVQVSQNVGMGSAAIGLGGVSKLLKNIPILIRVLNYTRLVSVSVSSSPPSSPPLPATRLSVVSSFPTPFWVSPSSRPSVW
jgi:hypothetical protein